jgi:hypothetical protein
MRIEMLARAVAVWLVMTPSAPLFANAQNFDFDSDVKLVQPKIPSDVSPDYVTLETAVPMTGTDLFEYFRAASPNSKFSDFLAANPKLGTLNRTSQVDAGTHFFVPRPQAAETVEE